MENVLIKTAGLSFQDKIFYQDISILRNKVNFIVGSSGTGKSTLLKLFNATVSPSKGTIQYEGEEISQIDTIRLRKEILLISQSVFLFDSSIRDNFRQFYEYRGLTIPEEQVMQKFLSICCIPFPLEQNCTMMSGGERQRVYIAIFLSFLPKLLMLDEPTSALDKDNSYHVIQNVIDFCRKNGITVIIVSHDPVLTETFAENRITITRREGV